MALIHCRECGKEISDQAPTCPYCGCPSEIERQRRNLQGENAKTKGRMNALRGGIAFGLLVFFPCWLMYGFAAALMLGVITCAVIAFASMGMIEYRIKKKSGPQDGGILR